MRTNKEKWTKYVSEWYPRNGKKKRGGQIKRWEDDLPKGWRSTETVHETVLRERTCREWFQKFQNGDFDVEDKDLSGRPKFYVDAELEELLEEDSYQTQKELALTLEVIQHAVSHPSKSLGIIHKQGSTTPSAGLGVERMERALIEGAEKQSRTTLSKAGAGADQPTRHIHQTLRHPTIISSGQWRMLCQSSG
ncbi:Mariner Mos1 transposase [Eumeta japonica]|uniref:Mariner Mos1 transposase n=1 Tax=Eumeta variegata TaxID=151549 RepID=A0A4C1SNK3_EUMVA|nr:Mariner Mos1 transposase [Eumeta japonica]